jgi:hypothetical protein
MHLMRSEIGNFVGSELIRCDFNMQTIWFRKSLTFVVKSEISWKSSYNSYYNIKKNSRKCVTVILEVIITIVLNDYSR